MVNESNDIKSGILEILFRNEGRPVSGELLGQNLGISRVAVWKHIKALTALGHDIHSSSTGYLLADPQNLLLPFCFPDPYRQRIFFEPVVETTMDTARHLALSRSAPHMGVVASDRQTRGRGRLNRQWVSEKGGLWFTIILFPDIPPAHAHIFNFAASLCLVKALKSLYDIQISVKWPNDLLAGKNRKLCGLLSEMETRSDIIRFLTIGIGLNVNNNPSLHEARAVSLKDLLGRPVSRRQILLEFLVEFEHCLDTLNPGRIIDEYRQQTSTIGRHVRIETFDTVIEGLATDVDENGALKVLTQDGLLKPIIYGDCFYTE